MMRACTVHLVDSNASDRSLSSLLLKGQLPHSTIVTVADAIAFADALSTSVPDVAVVATEQSWAGAAEIVAAIKRRAPAATIVLFGQEADIVAHVFNQELVCDGFLRKNSAGFLELAGVVTAALDRIQSAAEKVATESPRDTSADEHGRQEMRDMAMVFSHDLREPLQQIVRLAELGQADRLNDGAIAGSSAMVLACARRATQMVDGMFDYLSVATRDTAPAAVDLNSCLAQALDNLRGAIDESHADIAADHLPMAVGDACQLLHLFQNLVSNAIKFRGPARPRIRIGTEARGAQQVLMFRDNGIGIAPEFRERVFEMGQRLHTRKEFPGIGVGLTLCRRIVERHGGRIWIEPSDREGSTFCILLPGLLGDQH